MDTFCENETSDLLSEMLRLSSKYPLVHYSFETGAQQSPSSDLFILRCHKLVNPQVIRCSYD